MALVGAATSSLLPVPTEEDGTGISAPSSREKEYGEGLPVERGAGAISAF